MKPSRIKPSLFCLIVVALIAGCAQATPLPATATARPVPHTPTAPPLPTAPPTPTVQPLVEESPETATHTATVKNPETTTAPETLPDYWPTDDWHTSTPEEQGVDSDLLEQMLKAIDEQRLNVHSVIVVRNGTIIAETYYSPYDQEKQHAVWSVTKSFISALIGIAIEQGLIDGVGGRVVDFFPEREFANLDRRKEAMTLEHLLRMTSGLDWQDGISVFQEMDSSGDWVQYVLDRPMVADPGIRFNYCSGCSHILSAILQETTGVGTLEFAQTNLLGHLGITNLYWESDGAGIPNGGWGMHLTPRDMAKLGLLYLNGGVWEGQQIVPAEWVKASLIGKDKYGAGWGYGYQWWIYPRSGYFAAIGYGSQLVVVIPELNIVVVFTAALDDNAALFDLIDEYVVPAAES